MDLCIPAVNVLEIGKTRNTDPFAYYFFLHKYSCQLLITPTFFCFLFLPCFVYYWAFKIIFLMFILERERERQSMRWGGRGKGREIERQTDRI